LLVGRRRTVLQQFHHGLLQVRQIPLLILARPLRHRGGALTRNCPYKLPLAEA